MDNQVPSDSATVAAQLLAFYRQPARYRGRLFHGESAFFGGTLILKYAQSKWPAVLTQGRSDAEVRELRDAARFFLRQICFRDEATYYQILCVPRDAKMSAIKDHYRALVAMIHPDRVEANGEKWPQEYVSRVNRAYSVLSEEALRADYDISLRPRVQFLPQTATEESWLAKARRFVMGLMSRLIARPVLLAIGLVLSLLLVEIWRTGDIPEKFTLLGHSIPVNSLSSWFQKPLNGSAQPRISTAPDLARLHTSATPSTDLSPPKVITPAVERARGRRDQGAGDDANRLRSDRLPQGDANVVTLSNGTVAQDRIADPALTAQVEAMMFKIVNAYESGDLVALLSLMDSRSVSVEYAEEIQKAFSVFFATTRERRLRLKRVIWRSDANSVVVSGDANVSAVGAASGAPMERMASLEFEMTRHEGRLEIQKISLYPHEKK